jgi:hypothetical protein
MSALVTFGWLLLAAEALFVLMMLATRDMGDDAAGRGLATAWGLVFGAVLLVAGSAFAWGQLGGPRVALYGGLLVISTPVLYGACSVAGGGLGALRRWARQRSRVTFADPRLSRLARAIAANDVAGVRAQLTPRGLDFAARSGDGRTILGFAIEHAVEIFEGPIAVEPVRLLLEAGARPLPDVLEAEGEGQYAEHRLVVWIFGRGDQAAPVLDRVLHAGADPNARDRFGEPLLASTYARPPAVEVLLRRGIDVNAPDLSRTDRPRWSPLMTQVLYQAWEVVTLLLDHGADADYRADDGKTVRDVLREIEADDDPLHRAVRERLGVV